MKKKILFILILLILVSGCSLKKKPIQTNNLDESVFQVKVTVDEINIRKDPTTASLILGKVYKGDIYTVKDYTRDGTYLWFHIQTRQNLDGYIASDETHPYVEMLHLKEELDFEPPVLKLKEVNVEVMYRKDITLDFVKQYIEVSDNEGDVDVSFDVDYGELVRERSYRLVVKAEDRAKNFATKTMIVTIGGEKQAKNGNWLTYEEVQAKRQIYLDDCRTIPGSATTDFSRCTGYTDGIEWTIDRNEDIVLAKVSSYGDSIGIRCNYDAETDYERPSCMKDGDSVNHIMVKDQMVPIADKYLPILQKHIKDSYEKTGGYTLSDLSW